MKHMPIAYATRTQRVNFETSRCREPGAGECGQSGQDQLDRELRSHLQFRAMSLAKGSKLGGYEIIAPIGAWGMGEVYRARDGKLKRDVAIKVILEDFAQDAERMKRFEREAQVLASLNHPHIASIYGLEENALILELVEGPTVAGRIMVATYTSESESFRAAKPRLWSEENKVTFIFNFFEELERLTPTQ